MTSIMVVIARVECLRKLEHCNVLFNVPSFCYRRVRSRAGLKDRGLGAIFTGGLL